MSRDLTCNESLAEDAGGTNNFSPTQGRFNASQQQPFSGNSAQSIALLREQLLQQQLQNQQSSPLATSLMRAQSLGSSIDSLAASLTSPDNPLLAQLHLLQQQQNQQRLALLTQSNLYGHAASAFGNLGISSSTNNADLNNRSILQQLATVLGLSAPAVQNVPDNSETLINQLLQQIQGQLIQNAQGSLAQTSAARTTSLEQQLLSRLLNPTQNSGTNNTQLLIQQKIQEILQSPQILQIARELTEQHSAQAQQNQQQFAKQELRQTQSYSAAETAQRQQSDLVNQYLQRVVAQCAVSESSSYPNQQTSSQTGISFDPQQILQQHARQTFVSQANSFLNNLQSAYLMQHENSQQLDPSQSNRNAKSPRILKRSRPSSSTPAASRPLSDYTIEELKQKQSDLVKNAAQFEGTQQSLVDEYQRIQNVINSKMSERNGSDQFPQHRHNLDQFYATKEQHSTSQSNDTRYIANIPTLAAFRQVPGQDIFENHQPKKRIKQDFDKDLAGLNSNRQTKLQETKKNLQKVVPKKLQNGSSNSLSFGNHELINIDSDDFDSYSQPVNTYRKRGRPRASARNVGQRVPRNIQMDNLYNKSASPTRTILHDAVDIFLKPGETSIGSTILPRKRLGKKLKNLENEQLLSKINTLAAAISMTSPKDSDLLSPTDSTTAQNRLQSPERKFDLNSPEMQSSIEKFKEQHPELKEMSDLEICGIKAVINVMQQNSGQLDAQKNKAIIADFVANSLQNGPNFWNILTKLPKKMLPSELKIVDYVFNKHHMLELAKAEMFTKLINDKKANKAQSRPLFRDFVDANERKNIQLAAMHLSFAQRRMDFVKNFIYEATLVRLLNGDYRDLRGDKYPRELFIEEANTYNRINKQFGQTLPEYSKFINTAEVECKLLNQMYRYRSQFFNEVHNRPFALTPSKRLTPDEIIILNLDVSKTLFNVVDSVASGTPYVTFEKENSSFLKHSYPSVEDFYKLAFKTCEPIKDEHLSNHEPNAKRTVIIKAKQSTNEIDELKQRLQTHLNNNFNELLNIHDAAYKIRRRTIELHRDDINHMLTSVQHSIQRETGRRCASVEAPVVISPILPIYTRRRCRSLDINVRSRVVNSIGVKYLRHSLTSTTKDEDKDENATFGPKEYHENWEFNEFGCLSERFNTLLDERQRLIAALIKITFVDKDARAVIDAACEKGVAVNTDQFKVDGARSRKHKIKSGISLANQIRRIPHLHRLQLSHRFKKHRAKFNSSISKFKRKEFNWWHQQMLNGRLESPIGNSNDMQWLYSEKQRKEANKFITMCKRMQSENRPIPYTPSLYIRDKNFIIKTLTERAFNNEMNFRHLKCVALKFYSMLDTERHAQFVKKMEKIEAPRLDTVLKMRNDLTIGYLYELPTYELRSSAQQKYKGCNSIKVMPNPDAFDDIFGGKAKNPYRNPLLFPVTTPQFEVNSAQLTKYRNRETDSTSAERLHNFINLTTCARALMRLIYQAPKYGEELAIFMSHPAFKVFDSEQGDQNGFPSTVYQVAITKAVDQKKVPIEKRKMPDFKSEEEANRYFKDRQRSLKEKFASVLTTAHKHTVLNRRCIKTIKKLSGIEKSQNAKISMVRQHFNSLSMRSKGQFVKHFRMERFNETTQIESDVRQEDNLKAPLVVPGFQPDDSELHLPSSKLPIYIQNDILSPPKVQLSSSDELRSSMRGGKMGRGRGGNRRRAGKY